jgi:hypothetical protein
MRPARDEYATFPSTFQLPENSTKSDKIAAAHVSAFMASAMMVEHWMRQNASPEICMMIVEDNDRARTLIRDNQRFHQDPRFKTVDDMELRKHFPLRKIKEDPAFQPKKKGSPLQISDFCAYAFRRFLMQDRKFDRFVEVFWPHVVRFDPWIFRRHDLLERVLKRFLVVGADLARGLAYPLGALFVGQDGLFLRHGGQDVPLNIVWSWRRIS